MGLGGVDQLHQASLGLVDEVLLLQHDAQRVADVEENRLDIRGHKKFLLLYGPVSQSPENRVQETAGPPPTHL